MLINNAGASFPNYAPFPPLSHIETTFGTNYLAPFLFAGLIKTSLAGASAPRIVNVSSTGHHYSPMRWDAIGFDGGRRGYGVAQAYGQSKTALMLWSVEVGRRWADMGVTSFSVNPGGTHSLPPVSGKRRMTMRYPQRFQQRILQEASVLGQCCNSRFSSLPRSCINLSRMSVHCDVPQHLVRSLSIPTKRCVDQAMWTVIKTPEQAAAWSVPSFCCETETSDASERRQDDGCCIRPYHIQSMIGTALFELL